MKNCGSKIKHTCVEKNYATCISYEPSIPAFSALASQPCLTLEETTIDTYSILGGILEDISMAQLGGDCIDFSPSRQGLKVKDVILELENQICLLKDRVHTLETTAICNADITHCTGLDLTGINNSCATPVTTLGELLDYLLNHSTP